MNAVILAFAMRSADGLQIGSLTADVVHFNFVTGSCQLGAEFAIPIFPTAPDAADDFPQLMVIGTGTQRSFQIRTL
jgi:hypothetical protein